MAFEATLAEIAEATGGEILGAMAELRVRGVSTDSRTLQPGELFVALKGERFDGHDFVEAARQGGAAAALVSQAVLSPLPQVLVKDTLAALGDLAAWWRRRKPDVVVIGVTGSSGKTTTKGMLAAACAAHGPTLATPGSENAEIGVPRTLLGLENQRYCVLEMAMRGTGQIAYLAEMARPQVGVITNIGEAHIGMPGLGTRERIAAAKGELLVALPPEGTAVLNAEDFFFGVLSEMAPCRVVSFGLEKGDFRAKEVALGRDSSTFRIVAPDGEVTVELPLPGLHNVANALAATAAAWAAGVPIEVIAPALGQFRGEPLRSQVMRRADGAVIINDAYNANPSSVSAALKMLSEAATRRVLVFGDMLELGELAEEAHRAVGRQAAEAGVAVMVAVGELAGLAGETAQGVGVEVHFAADAEDAARIACALVKPGDTVLVKASRAMGLEVVAEALLEASREA
ncbi:MAG: UDP-N-acetylmuramoyl-tripeptide--D-alanyl-D-alanine ligase [Armatimonadetes bacterium]|nr:UDP-N-acetylmuramoyl-tripeptide--D-alanyl-D-alanine ligase [Armatimonadota bacterium]